MGNGMKWRCYFGEKNDDLRQSLFLGVKKPEIKETKGTFISPTFKSSYWGPLSGLKSQDLIKTSQTFTGVILCRRPFCCQYFGRFLDSFDLRISPFIYFSTNQKI